MSQLSPGVSAPDFELSNLDGQARKLSEALAGGRVVLAFYKASCPTCQFTFPFIQRINAEFAKQPGKPLTIWGISQDDLPETRNFAAQLGISFELLVDEHPYPVSAAYGLEYVPGIFIVEPNGIISVSDFGFTKSSLNAIAGYEFMKPDDGLPAARPG